jgi:hypothetical protein
MVIAVVVAVAAMLLASVAMTFSGGVEGLSMLSRRAAGERPESEG